mgnify:CR=1 FL=1
MDLVCSENNIHSLKISNEFNLLIELKKDLSTEISQLKYTLDTKQNMLKNITNFIYTSCPHEFETDFYSCGAEKLECITICTICDEKQR